MDSFWILEKKKKRGELGLHEWWVNYLTFLYQLSLHNSRPDLRPRRIPLCIIMTTLVKLRKEKWTGLQYLGVRIYFLAFVVQICLRSIKKCLMSEVLQSASQKHNRILIWRVEGKVG